MRGLEPRKTRKASDDRSECTKKYTNKAERCLTQYFDGYKTIIASPKEKKRYLSLTAVSYTDNISSLPHIAATSIMRVLSGR